jgi:hypothetical protein
MITRRAPIRRTPIRRKRNKPRPGRLRGNELSALRAECFERDGFLCQVCDCTVYEHASDFNPRKAHMSHIRNKRMWGDVISNVETRCNFDHMITKHNAGKPCPRKSA